jgi:hypothetical protein
MNIEQVNNAIKALGLDPANTTSVAIWDDRVVWETVEVREDGNEYTPHEARIVE